MLHIYETLYRAITGFYFFTIRIAALHNQKAKAFVNGRTQLFKNLTLQQSKLKNCIWFHCASLGEFEQARPLIELIKTNHPTEIILLTFFSPSGYDVKKKYHLADFVCYLPNDTPKNAKLFIQLIQPKLVVFVKYEWWYFILKEIDKIGIPLYNIASIFTKQQIFFKSYGALHRKMLSFFATIFVQDENSKKLLNKIKMNNVEVTGDTRFDTVFQNFNDKKTLTKIEQFKAGKKLIIGGSTYPTEDEFLVQAINNNLAGVQKNIIVPHDIDKEYCYDLKQKINTPTLLYSEISNQNLTAFSVLIIDSVGLLSNLYQYADIALIGGGFNKGIHNILEAVVFGVPVLFGPKHKKTKEAKDLVAQNIAFVVNDYQDFSFCVTELLNDVKVYNLNKKQLQNYVHYSIGATEKIYNHIIKQLN